MNRGAIIWLAATAGLSLLAAWLIHPSVLLGAIIGVAMTTLKDVHTEGDQE